MINQLMQLWINPVIDELVNEILHLMIDGGQALAGRAGGCRAGGRGGGRRTGGLASGGRAALMYHVLIEQLLGCHQRHHFRYSYHADNQRKRAYR